jgi:hypothetical protein
MTSKAQATAAHHAPAPPWARGVAKGVRKYITATTRK